MQVSMIVTWLGEQITDKGYGNGVSMIIFAGIVSSIPEMIKEIYENAFPYPLSVICSPSQSDNHGTSCQNRTD